MAAAGTWIFSALVVRIAVWVLPSMPMVRSLAEMVRHLVMWVHQRPGYLPADTNYLVVVKGTGTMIFVKVYGMSDSITEPTVGSWDVEAGRSTGVLHDWLEMTTNGLAIDELRFGSTFALVTSAGTPQVTESFDYPLPINTLGISSGIPVTVALNDTGSSMTNPDVSGLSVSLADFVTGGIDLSNVASVDLVIGAGGSGVLQVCNVTAYVSRCLSGYANGSRADIDNDCDVDLEDYSAVVADFGKSGEQVLAVDPGTSGLRLHYKFDEVSGTTVADESANNFDGTLNNEIWDGGSVNFNGDTYVDVPVAAFATVDDEVTVSLWVYGDVTSNNARQFAFQGATASGVGHILSLNLPHGDNNCI